MPQKPLIDYIRRPDTMDKQAIEQLKLQIEEYPYFHAARILLLQALHKHHSLQYDQELKRNAVMVPSRASIFHLTEEAHYKVREERKRYGTSSAGEKRTSGTDELISNFLDSLPQTPTSSQGVPVDATRDYISYMLQNEQDGEEMTVAPMNGGGVVEEFLEQGNGRISLNPVAETKYAEEPKRQEDKSEGKEIFTEIMAGIYIKQGKYESAIKIIRQLSLKYPKKNRYFADQIRFLEKLVINEKNK